MFSISKELALTLLSSLPLTTQISLLHSALKIVFFTSSQSIELFNKLKTPSQPPVIIEVKDDTDDEYVLLSKY